MGGTSGVFRRLVGRFLPDAEAIVIYGICGDIHANLEAAQSVFAAMDEAGVRKIVCLGDHIGYGAAPGEVLDLLQERGAICISGNHDRYVTGGTQMEAGIRKETVDVIHWTRDRISPGQRTFLEELPTTQILEDDFLIVHGSPRHEDEYIITRQILTGCFRTLQQKFPTISLCFFAHTHSPMIATEEEVQPSPPDGTTLTRNRFETYLINPGSVGQPRDGNSHSGFLIYDSVRRDLTMRRVPYDIEAAQARLRAQGLAERLAERLATGR